jgi:hypothetical protein
VDFAELPGYLAAIQARVAAAAVPVAGAMAKTYEKHLVDITLTESGSHGPATAAGYPPSAPPGRPPMQMPGGLNGSLRGSVTMSGPTGGGGIGLASVAPHTIYAATLEWGSTHSAKRGPFMWLWVRYIGYQAVIANRWLMREVTIEERPYMRTAVAEEIANGELQAVAETTFEAVVWGA